MNTLRQKTGYPQLFIHFLLTRGSRLRRSVLQLLHQHHVGHQQRYHHIHRIVTACESNTAINIALVVCVLLLAQTYLTLLRSLFHDLPHRFERRCRNGRRRLIRMYSCVLSRNWIRNGRRLILNRNCIRNGRLKNFFLNQEIKNGLKNEPISVLATSKNHQAQAFAQPLDQDQLACQFEDKNYILHRRPTDNWMVG